MHFQSKGLEMDHLAVLKTLRNGPVWVHQYILIAGPSAGPPAGGVPRFLMPLAPIPLKGLGKNGITNIISTEFSIHRTLSHPYCNVELELLVRSSWAAEV